MKSLTQIGLAFLFVVLLSSIGFAQSGIITTYAGPGLPVNGAAAVGQSIDGPWSVASDGAGGFYVASSRQNRVYRVTADGKINLVAGNGTPGFSGDGGPAASAQLTRPTGVVADTSGNLFIADSGNNVIRKVMSSGVIITVAGDGTAGYDGDGQLATSAELNEPLGLAVDTSGNLFIADSLNQRIRKVTTGGVIRTVAGNGTGGFSGDYDGSSTSYNGGQAIAAQLNYPAGIAVDTSGNLFIADYANQRIRKVTSAGVISTFAGTGAAGYSGDGKAATSAQLYGPTGVAVDDEGNLFIADYSNQRIRKVTSAGVISTFAGTGAAGYSGDGEAATSAQLYGPTGVVVDASGNLFIADYVNQRVREVTSAGTISTVAGMGTQGFSGDGGPATSALLHLPTGVATDTSGNVFIADYVNQRVRKVTPDGVISTVAGHDSRGYAGDGGPATSAALNYPAGVAADESGSVYIADYVNQRVRKVTPDGVISTVAGTGTQGFNGDGGPATSAQLNDPLAVAVDAMGNLFIADHRNNRIRMVTPGGVISTVAGNGSHGYTGDGGPATSAALNYPIGVALDASGNVFIADSGNNVVREVTTDGVINTIAGDGSQGFSGDGWDALSAQLDGPWGVAVDGSGNVFIADHGNNVVREVTTDGVINTVVGNGTSGFSGDGGPATSAQINYPTGLAVDMTGNLLIADYINNRVRKVTAGQASLDLTLRLGGAAISSTTGGGTTPQAGYADVSVSSGAAPYGTAVFSFKENGVIVSEAAVPASAATTSARIFIDYRSAVTPVPGSGDAGIVDINTGIAIVNRGSSAAKVTYSLRNTSGIVLANGHGTVAGGAHFAKFINQLNDVASDFILPSDFPTGTGFGSLDIVTDEPVSVLALRMTINQRNEALFTTTPVADLTQTTASSPVYFPQFADGGGYVTTLILLNTSSEVETGTLQILDDQGAPLVVNQVGRTADSAFKYEISSGAALRFQTDGSSATTRVGWVQLSPDAGSPTPVGAGVLSFNPRNNLVTETGVSAVSPTTHARIYVDLSSGHNTGLAVANPGVAGVSVNLSAFQSDGVTEIGLSAGPLQLTGKGHSAKFADQFIEGLPAGFTGVLDISSSTPFAALTMRSLVNERNDFLLTSFPIADANKAASSQAVFPQIMDGGGYRTQFVLLGAHGASSTTLSFHGNDGTPLPIGK